MIPRPLRLLGYFVLLPVPLIGVVPWALHRFTEGPFVWQGSAGQWIGVWCLVNGFSLAGWCVFLLSTEGQGTPFPLDPPLRFVAGGPYRYVRNPMVLGMFLILIGEGMLYRSPAVWLYAAALAGAGVCFVRCVEEQELERRFGETYRAYRRQVPRWIPRRSP